MALAVKRHVKITVGADGFGTIEVNGERVLGLTGFTVSSRAGKPPVVTLDFTPASLHIEMAEAEVAAPAGERAQS